MKANTISKTDRSPSSGRIWTSATTCLTPRNSSAYIGSSGGELYNDDGTSAFDSAAAAEAMQYMYDRRRVMRPTEDYRRSAPD